MAYYSRHSIFLYDNDKQKLFYLQSLIEEEKLSFELREEIVYQYDGEPLNMLCISDANYGPEIGCAWYSFYDDMERVSEKFNQRYPDDRIAVYVKTEDSYEILYEFHDGVSNYTDIIHFQTELNKVCEELNLKNAEVPIGRTRHIILMHKTKWNTQQQERAVILFMMFPKLEEAYNIYLELVDIFNKKSKPAEARLNLARWYNKVEAFGDD